MKRNRSALARTLDHPAVIKAPPPGETARRLERWYARAVLVALAALAMAFLAACETTNTQMKGVWVSPDKGRAPVGSVLVIGVNRDSTAQPSSSMQQTVGDFAKLLVKALAEAGVIA